MRQKTRESIRRKMSGSLACLLAAISVFTTSSTIPTLAADNSVTLSYKQEKQEKLGIFVEAENESFSAGETVRLNVFIQNNSGVPLKDGILKWTDKKQTLTTGGFVLDSEEAERESEMVSETTEETFTKPEEAGVETEETFTEPEETVSETEDTFAETEGVEAETEETFAETEETGVETEETFAETEGAGVETEETFAELKETEPETEAVLTETEETVTEPENSYIEPEKAAEESETAPSKPAGPSSDEDEDFGTAWEEDWLEEDEESASDTPYLDENGNLCGISLAAGEIFQVQFTGTIEEDISGLKNRDLRFSFGAKKPNGKRLSNYMKFSFNTGLMTMLPVEFADGNLVETNEENTMLLRLGLDDIEYMFDTAQKEKENAATPSDAQKATSSEAGTATPSELEEAAFTPAEVIKPDPEDTSKTETEAKQEESVKAETEEAVTEESAEAETEASGETKTEESEESAKAETEESAEAETEASGEAKIEETEESEKAETEESVKAETEQSEEVKTEESAEAETEASGEAKTEESEKVEKAETEESEEAEIKESVKAETEASAEAETEASEAAESEKSEEAEPKESVETETEESVKEEIKESTEAETETSAEAEPEESVKSEPTASAKTESSLNQKSEQKATPSESEAEEDEDEEIDENHSNGIFKAADVKYTIETYGVRLQGVKARFDETASGPAESVAEVSYRVASGTEPGLYFGRVTASVKYHGNTYKTVQGFHIKVTGEGQMALRGKLGDAEIIVAGDPSSFGAEDHEILSLQVKEISSDKEDLLSEAMQKKAEETGVAVEEMRAVDIKVIADGEVKELEGPVTVTFAGLELEALDVEKAEKTKKEKSFAEQAIALLGLGEETAEAVEAEPKAADQTTEVWHLDEDAVELNAMESYINEEGDVVMETDHFSIYIVVNVADTAEVPLHIVHKAEVDVWKQVNGTVVETENAAGTYMLPGASSVNADGTGIYDKALTEIYTPDDLTLPNGAGTGLDYTIAVQKLSKLSLGGNYKVKSVKITNVNYPEGKTVTETNTDEKLYLAKTNNTIEIIYEPTVGSTKGYVGFHDYNVTIEGPSGANDSIHPGLNTKNVGMNHTGLAGSNADGNRRIGIGIQGTSYNQIQHGYTRTNANTIELDRVTGIPGSKLVNNSIQFNYADPGLFTPTDITTSETYKDGSSVAYYAKKYLPNYQLGFIRKGDTYTLSSVYDNTGREIESDLEKIKYTCLRADGKSNLYSNLFWPLDTVAYGEKGKTRDHLYGYATQDNPDTNKYVPRIIDKWHFGANDEGTKANPVAHNWFFGMRYDFEFTLGDYTGPMNYYFRGDDDFWLFIDGTLVGDVDIGGIHSSIGAYVDLRTWMQKEGMLSEAKKDTPHKMSVFFMERGGFGSCCYMSFTLPNISSIPTPESATIEKTVTKTWVDGKNNGKYRPNYVYAQLKQNGSNYGNPVKLEENNGWTYTWSNLPKYSNVNSDTLYEYTVAEVSAPSHYEGAVNGFTITNTLMTSVDVKKVWEDAGNQDHTRPDSVMVQLKQNGLAYGDPVELNEANNWKTSWGSLPVYANADTTEPYRYTVEETGHPSWYTSSISGTAETGFVITNTYTPQMVTRMVKKVWADQENLFGLRPETVSFQLKQEGTAYGNAVVLPQKGQELEDVWEYTWEKLPKYYYIKTDGVVTQHEFVYTVEEVQNYTNAEYYTPSTATESKEDTAVTTVTNTLKTAKFRVAKRINNINTTKLDYNDLAEDEFMITVDQIDGKFSTGFYLTHAGDSDDALKSEKISAYIEVPVTDQGVSFVLDEVVPKEYQKADTFLTLVAQAEEKAALKDDRIVTVYEGSDVIVVVHNVFQHTDFFHSDASVDNKFDHDKIPDRYKKGYVNLAALLPAQENEDEEDGDENRIG